MPDPAAADAAPTHARSPGDFHRALAGLAAFVVVLGVGRHVAEALAATAPEAGTLGERLAAIAPAAWAFAAAHVVAAVASLAVGAWLIAAAYPLRGLAALAPHNPAAAIQSGAHVLAATAIAGASWGGCDAASLAVSAAFCALGWVAVVVVCAGHRLVTRYRDHEEVAAGNVAAALAAAGLHLAVALVVARAIQGQFLGWSESLRAFAIALAWVLALWPLRELVLARLILRRSPRAMDEAVARRHDVWIGAAEGACYVISAALLSAGW